MGTGKKALAVLVLLALGGPLEASRGGRVVRAAVRLQAAVEKRVEDPTLRAGIAAEVERLANGLRAAAADEADVRQAAYLAALERVRLIDAVVVYSVPQPARGKVMRAAAALERALMRASGSRPRRR